MKKYCLTTYLSMFENFSEYFDDKEDLSDLIFEINKD